MKNSKKGFTLIELLAVVAILAILSVIAVPNVLKLFQSSKVTAFKTQAQTIFKAAEQQIINDQISPPVGIANLSDYTYCYSSAGSTQKLLLTGSTTVYYEISVKNNKITSFVVTDGIFKIDKSAQKLDGYSISELGDPVEGSLTVTCGS